MFDDISDDEHNRFTKRDVLDAMNMYQENYVTYSRAEVERVSGISVPPNKRNGRKQEQHIKIFERLNTQTEHGETKTADQRSRKLSKNGERATQTERKLTVFVILD